MSEAATNLGGGDGIGAGEGSGEGQGGQQPSISVTSWRDSIKDEGLKKFASNYNTVEDLAKSGLEFRQKLSNAIFVPGQDASPEDKAAFRQKLGVPDSPEGYLYQFPEGFDQSLATDEVNESFNKLKGLLHGEGATPNVVKASLDFYANLINESAQAQQRAQEASLMAAEQSLQKEWGAEFDTNTEYAKRAFKQFGGDEFVRLVENAEFEGTPLHAHPGMLKVFSSIGRRMGEGGLQTVVSAEQRQSMEQRMDQLTEQAYTARARGNYAESDRLYSERDKIAQEYYGSE